MNILEQMSTYGHEQVMLVRDQATGLKAIIAIHNTTLGPALGGTRFWNYATEEDALFDVLRLSRGMTLKSAAAGLALGGGKTVIIGDPAKLKSREFFHAFGRFINTLNGNYYTAEDVNIGTSDVAMIGEVSKFVVGTPDQSGDPGPFTARGVYLAMKAGAGVKFGSESLKGKTVAIQGIGSVGRVLCEYLAEEGAILKVCSRTPATVEQAVKDFGATAVPPEEILSTECDIFSPCAMGAVLNRENVGALKCSLIAGGANNVLLDAETGDMLSELGILYLPDYIVNAGGVINCGMEVAGGHDIDKVNAKVENIYNTTLKVLALAEERKISTYQAAEEYAWSIVEAGKQ